MHCQGECRVRPSGSTIRSALWNRSTVSYRASPFVDMLSVLPSCTRLELSRFPGKRHRVNGLLRFASPHHLLNSRRIGGILQRKRRGQSSLLLSAHFIKGKPSHRSRSLPRSLSVSGVRPGALRWCTRSTASCRSSPRSERASVFMTCW